MRTVLFAAALLVLASCGGNDPVANNADASGLPDIETLPPDEMTGSGDAEGNAATVPADESAATVIPAALQGRWGLAPGDCTSTRGDAKGLMVVEADRLRFYESVAHVARLNEARPDSISGDFSFQGEGMEWSRYMTLQVRDGKLIRTESEPMASYTYARCA